MTAAEARAITTTARMPNPNERAVRALLDAAYAAIRRAATEGKAEVLTSQISLRLASTAADREAARCHLRAVGFVVDDRSISWG